MEDSLARRETVAKKHTHSWQPHPIQWTLVNDIVNGLLKSDTQRLTDWLDRIVAKNQLALDNAIPTFLHDGEFFRHSSFTANFKGRRPPLHSSLYDEMAKFLKDRKTCKEEQGFMRQALVCLFENCETFQDARDALPLFLEPLVPGLIREFQRTRPPLWCLEPNTRQRANFDSMIPNLQVYAATRLL